VSFGRLVALILIVGGIGFGLWGGLYSTLDWWKLKRRVADEEKAIVRLEVEIDSLTAWAAALESDSATQERVARERFGMIRNGEILYRVEPIER
jgi:cell division protein FtsB